LAEEFDIPLSAPARIVITGKPVHNGFVNTMTDGETWNELSAVVLPVFVNQGVVWSSADTGVAVICEITGVIQAQGAGNTVIRAVSVEDSEVKADFLLTVLPKPITVYYFGNGHTSGIVPSPHNVNIADSIILKSHNLIKSSHRFEGWLSSISGNIYQPGQTVNITSDELLYFSAVWISYATINYISDGHIEGTIPASHIIDTPGTIQLKNHNLKKPGYRFSGWQSANDIFQPGETVDITGVGTRTFSAVWTSNLIMNYEILVSSEFSTDSALNYINASKSAFFDTFEIQLIWKNSSATSDLDEKDGCDVEIESRFSICNESCGELSECMQEHHRSGSHFLRVNQGNRNKSVFKFVDFPLCSFLLNQNDEEEHTAINGIAFLMGDTILVTSFSDNPQRTTAHEISHLFGATDGDCTSEDCVMFPNADVFNEWCVFHENQIRESINKR
jgi:hypothetical protein